MATVDALVQDGRFASRSEAVRTGLSLAIERARTTQIDRAFAEGLAARPETSGEVERVRRMAVASIEDEPWEPWW